MNIVTWNCNGAFRKKFDRILSLNADIYIIQECENINLLDSKSLSLLNNNFPNYFWTGDSKHKGLGIFARQGLSIEPLLWNPVYRNRVLKHFLPIKVNNKFIILAVWTHKADAQAFGYIGQFWLYLQNNKSLFQNIIIAGDFNSNSIWDSWDRWWNHSDCVNELEELGIYSIYHKFFNQKQGHESINTFLLHKNINKGYHIDYIFASNQFINALSHFEVGIFDNWIDISDHVPISFSFDDVNRLT